MNVINYPPSINNDRKKLEAVYSLIEQMRLEHNRQHDIYASDKSKYQNKWLSYIEIFRKKQCVLLREQSRFRDLLLDGYGRDRWASQFDSMTGAEQRTLLESLWGNREALKSKSTSATCSLIDELKSIDLDVLADAPYADPTEVFTDYTPVDTNSRFTIISNKITVTSMTGDDSGQHVYADKGADHFGDFEHLYQQCVTSINSGASLFFWSLANSIGDYPQSPALYMYFQDTTAYMTLLERPSVNLDYYNGAPNTDYFMTVSRDGTDATAEIRTGSHEGTLVDTLAITCATTAYRYIYGVSNYDDNDSGKILSGYIQDLDLQEAAGGWGGEFCGVSASEVSGVTPAEVNGV